MLEGYRSGLGVSQWHLKTLPQQQMDLRGTIPAGIGSWSSNRSLTARGGGVTIVWGGGVRGLRVR